MNQDWELLDPELKIEIKKLNKNIVILKKENEELKETLDEVKTQLKNIKKLNIEHVLMFNKINKFLEDNRIRYMSSFNNLHEKIGITEKKMENELKRMDDHNSEQMKDMKVDIEKHSQIINKKLFDPNFRLRINNMRWRNNGMLSLVNPEI